MTFESLKVEAMKTVDGERALEPMSTRWKHMTDTEKRQRIVDAVLLLIGKHGLQGTTTARIAATVGVSEPTLYRLFRNRQEMLLAAADAMWQMRRDDLDSAEGADAIERLRTIGEHHTRGIQRSRVAEFLYEMAVSPPSLGLREHLREQHLRDVQHLMDIIDEGKVDGSVRKDVDSWEAAWRIMAFFWLEATARLHGLEDVVMDGFSTRVFDSILKEIAE